MKTCEFKIENWYVKRDYGHNSLMLETTIGPKAFNILYCGNPIDCSTGESFKEIVHYFRKDPLEMLDSIIGRTFRINVRS